MEHLEICEGNTRTSQIRVSQGKRWCFTYNNYTVNEMEQMELVFKEKGVDYIFEEEVGDEGTPHLQGYIEVKKRIRPFQLRLPKQIHWEKARGARADNIAYCSKDHGQQARYSLSFKPPRPLKILAERDLRDWQKGVCDIISREPNDRTLHWYWSATGNVGKTTFCKYLTSRYGAIPLAGKGADVRNGVVSYVEKNDKCPEVIVVPVPRSYDEKYLSYEGLENCKDMYFYSGKYEGAAVCGNPPHVFVFTNFYPDIEKMSEDRWVIWQIDGMYPDDFPR